jgi:hypothetical protein
MLHEPEALNPKPLALNQTLAWHGILREPEPVAAQYP